MAFVPQLRFTKANAQPVALPRIHPRWKRKLQPGSLKEQHAIRILTNGEKRKEGEHMARPYKTLTADSIPAQQYFTVAEVAAITGSHIHTIQRRLREGKLQGKKLGGEWKIYAESVNAEVAADLNNEKGRGKA